MTRVALTFLARRGGVPRTQVWLANALADLGVQVSIVVPRSAQVDLTHVGAAVDVVSLAVSSRGRFLTRFAQHLRQRRPDSVLACQHHTGLLTLLAARLARYRGRHVVSLHSHISSVSRQQLSGRLLFPAMRVLYPQADTVVCVSEGVAQDFAAHVPRCTDRVRVIFNPLPIELLEREASAPCREPWLSEKDAPTYVAVGRLAPEKDYDTLLQAQILIRRQLPCRLILVGDGPLRGALESKIEDLGLRESVRIVGYQSNPYPFMSRADVLVVSSRREGLPLVIAEALALGVQVVSTDCDSGPAEILDRGRYGRLVPVGEPTALAEGIISAIRGEDRIDPTLLKKRAQAFRPETVARQYLELLGDSSTDANRQVGPTRR